MHKCNHFGLFLKTQIKQSSKQIKVRLTCGFIGFTSHFCGSAEGHFRATAAPSMGMTRKFPCKDVPFLVQDGTLMFMYTGVTEQPKAGLMWILPCCSHGAFTAVAV